MERDSLPRGRRAAGAARQGLTLWRSALRADSAAVLGLGSRRRTHYAPWGRYVQTTAASQMLMRAARADPSAVLLVAPEITPSGQHLPRGSISASWGIFRQCTVQLATVLDIVKTDELVKPTDVRHPRCASYSEGSGFGHAVGPAIDQAEKASVLAFLELL